MKRYLLSLPEQTVRKVIIAVLIAPVILEILSLNL